MIKLKSLTEDEKDNIDAKVGGSSFYLQARTHHTAFNPVTNKLTLLLGDKYLREVRLFVANTVAALKKGDTGFTYTRDKNKYAQFNKLNPKATPISYRRLLPTFDRLEELGFVTVYCGYKDSRANDSMSACITFNKNFISLFKDQDIIKHAPLITKSSVIVRDQDGNEIKGVKGIAKERIVIDDLNDWLFNADFNFGGYKRTVQLQSIYNGDLQTSGRVFFGGLQCIRSTKRRSILIEGCEVTEQDWSSQHYCILACLLGVSLPPDFKPYEIDVSSLLTMKGGYCKNKARKILKLASLLLINSGNPTTSFKNMWDSNSEHITALLDKGDFKAAMNNPFYGVSGKQNCSEVIKLLKAHNYYANTMFSRKGGLWGYLQNIDKNIIINTIQMMKERGCPMLPYHDSAVCKKSDKETLLYCMRESWYKVLGTYDNCYISEKF